eukprot:gene15381-20838_t
MARKSPLVFAEAMGLIEAEFLSGPWVMGERYTTADAYLYVVASWLPRDGIDMAQFPKVADHFARMGERAAVKAVLRLVDAWGGSNAEGAALLGVSESTWDRIKAGKWDGTLSQDQLTRASALIGVFKGLHLLFADGMADRWPRLPNRAPVFGAKSPVEAMIE